MLTLGIDPGTANLGWALVAGDGQPRFVDAGVITARRGATLGERLDGISSAIEAIISAHPVTHVALERLTFARNVTTAAAVYCACGVVQLVAYRHGLPAAEYAPTEIKSAVTGSGNASKSDVQHLLRAILQLSDPIEPDHAADAVATAICHIHNHDISRHQEIGR